MTAYLPLFAALILPWLPAYKSRVSLILAIILCYSLILLAVTLQNIHLKQQLNTLTGGQEFFPPTPESTALVQKISHDTAHRLAPLTALLPAILYPLLIAGIKRLLRCRASPKPGQPL